MAKVDNSYLLSLEVLESAQLGLLLAALLLLALLAALTLRLALVVNTTH